MSSIQRVLSAAALAATCVTALCVALTSSVAWAASDRQVVQATSPSGRSVSLIAGDEATWVREGESLSELALPPGAWLNRIALLENGWIAGGARAVEGGQDLFLYGEDASARWEYKLPIDRPGRIRQSVAPLVDKGRLAGIAWLEGSDFNGLAVRAAAFDGADFGPSETVSPPTFGGQVALHGEVLRDGSWLLVWSRTESDTTDTVWSRRDADGVWTAPAAILESNGVPDVTPALIASGAGALAAWGWFDGQTLRQKLARFDGETWVDTGYRGPDGSVYPSFTHGPEGPRLLFRTVVPWRWTLVELDPAGNALRQARVDEVNRERPEVSQPDEQARFWWPSRLGEEPAGAGRAPEAHRELRAEWEPVQ